MLYTCKSKSIGEMQECQIKFQKIDDEIICIIEKNKFITCTSYTLCMALKDFLDDEIDHDI